METLKEGDILESVRIPLSRITPNTGQIPDVPKNPRFIRDARYRQLLKSIQDDPEFLSINEIKVYPFKGRYVIIGGNMRYRALKELGRKEAVCKVIPEGVSPRQLRAYIQKDNTPFGDFDMDALANDWEIGELEDFGMELPDLDGDEDDDGNGDSRKNAAKSGEEDGDTDTDSSEEDKEDFFRMMLGDRIYDSDNEFDIPRLLPGRQPHSGLLLPFAGWGADTRAKKGIATYHFYVEDYRFTSIWNDPVRVLDSGCRELVEPNLSLFDTTPVAYGLQLIYMKRWIARFWQECGANVYADLNVARKFRMYNRLGIPEGYNAFATRGYADRQEYLKDEIGIAREISGKDNPNMIVYGGGEGIRELCLKNNIVYVEQFIRNRAREMKKREVDG